MMSQLGFFDIANRYAGLDAKNDPLVKLDAVVPWEDFRSRLEAAWRKPSKVRKSPAGRKPLDAVMMFKAIVLCSLYNLSDDQVEYQIVERWDGLEVEGIEAFDGGEPGLPDPPLDHAALTVDQFQLGQADKIPHMVGALGCALAGQLVVFAQKGRQLQGLEVMGQQQLRRIGHDAPPPNRLI